MGYLHTFVSSLSMGNQGQPKVICCQLVAVGRWRKHLYIKHKLMEGKLYGSLDVELPDTN